MNYSDKFGHNNGGIFWNFAEIMMIFQWNCGNISVILHKNLLVLWPNFTVFFLRNSIGISVEFWWNLGEISSTFSPGKGKGELYQALRNMCLKGFFTKAF